LSQNQINQGLSVTSPSGEKINVNENPTVIEVKGISNDKPWKIEIPKEKRKKRYYVKLRGAHPFGAYDISDLFIVPENAVRNVMPKRIKEDIVFCDGVFGKAIYLDHKDQLKIPVGKVIEGNKRENLDLQQGTVEFFFKVNGNQKLSKSQGIPFAIPVAKPKEYKTWTGHFIDFSYKNALLFMLPWEKHISDTPARFGPWGMTVGMTDLEVGKWYHLSVIWNCSKELLNKSEKVTKFVSRAFLDGTQVPASRWNVGRLAKGFSAPLSGEFIEMRSNSHDIIIDELRISSKPRLDYKGDPKQSYQVPSTPYVLDKETSILMHFDSNFDYEVSGNRKLTASWKNTGGTKQTANDVF